MASLPRSLGRAMAPERAQDEHIDKYMANRAFSMSTYLYKYVHSAYGLTLLHQDSLTASTTAAASTASTTAVEYPQRSVPHPGPYSPLSDHILRGA